MPRKKKSKDILIDYLKENANRDISREELICKTSISKSRLSELLNEIKNEGYNIIMPNRSGIVRFQLNSEITNDISAKEIRQWIIILSLSKLGVATYMELVCSILSIVDSSYLYDGISTYDNYSDMDILDFLEESNSSAKNDIDYFVPLPTLRKDLHALINLGYIDKKRTQYRNGIHIVYSLSENAPAILFESDETLYEFMTFYDNFKNSLSNTEPLELLHEKAALIYDWESYDTATQIYGKSNKIDNDQLRHLSSFVKYPYKSKALQIQYSSREGLMNLSVASGLLFYSSETNCFYLLCINLDENKIIQLRLDRIKSIQEGENKNSHYRSSEFLRIYEEMFSASFTSVKSHVKVLFQDFGNIRERITSLHNKRKSSKFYEIEPLTENIPHTLVFEDDLRGLSSFSRYLRSFGSSAIVLEPKELRDLMINSSLNLLNNYEVDL